MRARQRGNGCCRRQASACFLSRRSVNRHHALISGGGDVAGLDLIAAHRLRHHPGAAEQAAQCMKAARASADGVESPKLRPARLVAIKQPVAAYYGLTVNDLISARKERHATRARHIAMWLCRALSRERHQQTLTSPIKTFTLNLGSPRGQHSCLPTLLECKWAPLMKTSFFAYPTHHSAISETLRAAIQRHNSSSTAITLESWETNDISGIPISNPIFEKIASAQYVAADVTYLNENVAFEV